MSGGICEDFHYSLIGNILGGRRNSLNYQSACRCRRGPQSAQWRANQFALGQSRATLEVVSSFGTFYSVDNYRHSIWRCLAGFVAIRRSLYRASLDIPIFRTLSISKLDQVLWWEPPFTGEELQVKFSGAFC